MLSNPLLNPPLKPFKRPCKFCAGLLGLVPFAPGVLNTLKPPPKPEPNWVPSLTGTLRPTLVLFCPPSSTCIWVLCRSLDLPFDCKRLRLVGGRPSRKPAPPAPKAERIPTLPIPEGNRARVPKPPRFPSEEVFVFPKIGSPVDLSSYNGLSEIIWPGEVAI